MSAKSPEEICRLFQRAMAEGDLNEVLKVYDPEAVFLNREGEITNGKEELKQQLAPLAAAKARFDYEIIQVVETDGVALMHTKWNVSVPQPMTSHAIEVARRQPDGSWRWLIGDPFTVGKSVNSE